jgi:hypothetical protein
VSFVLSIAILGAGASWVSRRWVGPQGPLLEQDLSLQTRLPGKWIDPAVTKTSQVRTRHEFWAFEKSSVAGSAVRLLESPELRSALFPGYPEQMFADVELWRDYFGRDQSSTAWLPPLQSRSRTGVLLYQSWLGCLDIYRRYGADVVIFGSSETFRSVVPEVLAKSAGSEKRRVLLCTTTYSYPQQAEWVLHEMARAGKPVPAWIILGVSVWSLYQGHPAFIAAQAEKHGVMDRYLASRYGRFSLDLKPSEELRPPRWDDLFTPTWAMLSKHRSRVGLDLNPVSYLKAHPDAPADGEFLSSAMTGGNLDRALSPMKPSFPLFKGLSARECEGAEPTALEPVVRAARAGAGHVLVYVPPVSPRILATLPKCYLERFAAAINALHDEKTRIQAEGSASYGLTDADYIYSGEIDGIAKFDSVHTNYVGALKVSARIQHRLEGAGP